MDIKQTYANYLFFIIIIIFFLMLRLFLLTNRQVSMS